jgi:hypothetical protein
MGRVGRKKKTKALKQALADIEANSIINTIFDNIERTDDSPKKSSEKTYTYYNRSSKSSVKVIRELITDCLSRYPKEEVKELIARFKSGDNTHFKSALFELFLHEILFRQGYELFPHPDLPNGSSYKPDFLVKNKTGEEFYLEAVLATEKHDIDKGGELRKGVVLDTLSAAPHQNYMVAIDGAGSPNTPPNGKKLIKIIHKWLDSLDPDEVLNEIECFGLESIVPLEWEHDGWNLQIRPIPLQPSRRNKSSSLIGINGTEGGIVDSWSPIKNAIKFKGGKYGVLDKPHVVAVNLDSFHLKRIDEMQALFGEEQFVFQRGSNAEPKMMRAPNGAWYGKNGPQYTRVSAAWLFNDLHASSLAARNNTIYLNPWANHPIPESLKSFPHASPYKNEMQWKEGISLREVFDLPEDWPEHAS